MIKIGITSGMRGYYAVMYDDIEGPIHTGVGSYATPQEAEEEAREWAAAENLPCDCKRKTIYDHTT